MDLFLKKFEKIENLIIFLLSQALSVPVLVLHAEDDRIVPSHLGQRLVDNVVETGKQNIELVLFPPDLGLRHKFIYRAPEGELMIQNQRNFTDLVESYAVDGQPTSLEVELTQEQLKPAQQVAAGHETQLTLE